jgi:N-acetylmuramoyl-L-alanine amidase
MGRPTRHIVIAAVCLVVFAGGGAAALALGHGGGHAATAARQAATHHASGPTSGAGAATQALAESSPTAATSKPLAGKVIVIDPGHNVTNWKYPTEINRPVPYGPPGATKPCDTTGTATAAGLTEARYNLIVGVLAVDILRARGATVIMTPVNKVPWGPCITTRAALGNRNHADAAVSIHADGSPVSVHGFYVIVPAYPLPNVGLTSGMIRNDNRLGAAMLRSFHNVTAMHVSNLYRTGYLRSDAYGGTDLSHVPKIFIETGNMPNPLDARRMESPTFRHLAALGIANGIQLYLTGRG